MTKQVRFSESGNTCQLYEAPDVPSKELYLTQYDYDCIKMDIRVQTDMMKQPLSCSEQESTLCVRGLEKRTPGGMRRCHRNRKRALEAVLEEQQRQQSEGEDDDEMLAEVYRGFVSMCVRSALKIAEQDHHVDNLQEDVLVTKEVNSSEMTVATVETDGSDESSSSHHDCLDPVPATGKKQGTRRRKGHGIRIGRLFGHTKKQPTIMIA